MRKIYVLLLVISMMVSLVGCTKKLDTKKVENLDFTVVPASDVPEKLSAQITKDKEQGFKISYKDGEYMYITRGYGKQPTGGYSVKVKELYMSKNAICINTELIGPRENDMVLKAASYPYVVIKIENRDMDVIFN